MSTDALTVVATDWRPSRVEARRAIRLAILLAQDADGHVHIADFRHLLPSWIDGHQIGAFICHQVRAGRLVPTGRYRPNGDEGNRNRTKPAQVYRIAAPIPEEES